MHQNGALCDNGLIGSSKIVNSLPDNRILDWFKLKAFAEDQIKWQKQHC